MTVALLNNCRFECLTSGLSNFTDGPSVTGFRNLLDAGAIDGATYPYRAESADKSSWENGLGTYDAGGGGGAGELQRSTVLQSSNAGAKVDFADPPTVFVTLLAEAVALLILETTSRNVLGSPGTPMIEGDYTLGEVSAADCAANSATLAAIAASGEEWYLPEHSPVYSFDRRIDFVARTKLIGKGTFVMPKDFFTGSGGAVVFTAGGRYGPDRVGFLAMGSGATLNPGVEWRGFTMRCENSDEDRFIVGLMGFGVQDFVVDDCEVSGIPDGAGIMIGSAFGKSRVNDCWLHDIGNDFVMAFPNGPTGVYVDTDLSAAGASTGPRVTNNVIEDCLVGPTVVAAWGQQGNGIKNNRKNSSLVRIEGNTIRRTGQGVDCYSQDAIIADNDITDAVVFGIAGKYGMKRPKIFDNRIRRAGAAGIALTAIGGAGDSNGDIEDAEVYANDIREMNPDNDWADSCAILLSDTGGVTVNRAGIRDNRIDLTTGNPMTGVYEDLDEAGLVSNDIGPNKIIGAGSHATKKRIRVETGKSRVGVSDPSLVRAVQTGTLSVPNGASYTDLDLAQETYDRRSEFANPSWTCQVRGTYRFYSFGAYGSVPASVTVNLGIFLNGSLRPGEAVFTNNAGGVAGSVPLASEISMQCEAGDVVKGATKHTHSAALNFAGGVFKVEALHEVL